MPASREQLQKFVQRFRDAYVKAGGKQSDVQDDQKVIQKMEQAHVTTEYDAEQAAQKEAVK